MQELFSIYHYTVRPSFGALWRYWVFFNLLLSPGTAFLYFHIGPVEKKDRQAGIGHLVSAEMHKIFQFLRGH